MLRTSRPFAFALACTLWVTAAHAAGTDVSQISGEEFFGAAYYRGALVHPKIQALKEPQRIAAVARDIHWPPKKLKAAIAKVDALGADPAELAARAVKQATGQSRLRGRVLDVLLNTDEPRHVVAYVRWQAKSKAEVVKDASAIAQAVAAHAPFVATLSLAAIPPAAPASSKDAVWSAKIGRESMARIQPARIEDYADRLYRPLFEGIDERPF